MKSIDRRRHMPNSKTPLMLSYGESAIARIIMNQRCLPWIISVFYFIGYSHCETTSPLNHAVVSGTKIRLNCSHESDPGSKWAFDPIEERFYTITENHTDESSKGIFSIDNSANGHYALSFTATKNISGMFMCTLGSDSKKYFRIAQVVVLDAKPACSGTEIPGFIRAICSIGFHGYWIPVFEWRNAKGKLEPNDTVIIRYKRVTSSVIVPFRVTDDRASYIPTCTIKFTLDNLPENRSETSRNIPEFPSGCTPEIRKPGYSLHDTSSPLNHAVIKGTKVQLNCSDETYTDVGWKYQNNTYIYTIYYDHHIEETLKDRFSIDDSVKGHFDLSFTAAEETSGMYMCAAFNTSLAPFYMVQVTVLDAQPICSLEETSGFVMATCSTGFSGHWSPKLEWSSSNGKLNLHGTRTLHDNNRVTNSVVLTSPKTDAPASSVPTCTTKFTLENIPADTSETNIPDFPSSCVPKIRQTTTTTTTTPGYNIAEKSTPLNRAVRENSLVQLNCSAPVGEFGYWSYISPSFLRQDEVRIYSKHGIDHQFRNIFSIDDSVKGRFHLLIKNSSRTTSGRYTCIQGHSEKVSSVYRAQVIVLDAKPACSLEYTTRFVRASCSIGFSGYWTPALEWSNAKGKLESTEPSHIQRDRVVSSVVWPFSETDPLDSYILTCKPTFTMKNKLSETSAQNIPEFPFSCTTTKPDKYEARDPISTGVPPRSFSSSVFDFVHYRHCPYLCISLVTLIFIDMTPELSCR